MDLGKIVRIVAVLAAVVLGLVAVPQGGMIIAVLGLVAGYFIEGEYASRFLIGAVALGVSQGSLASAPSTANSRESTTRVILNTFAPSCSSGTRNVGTRSRSVRTAQPVTAPNINTRAKQPKANALR